MSIVGSTDEEINAVFDVYDTGGKGDCLFYSLGFALHNQLYTPTEAFDLRQAICKTTDIIINGVPLQAFVVVNEVDGEVDMCNQGTWGGDAEILKAAKIFNRPIIVYEQDRTAGLATDLVAEINKLEEIRAGTYCPRMQQYFTAPHFANVLSRMYTFYLPNISNESEPLLIFNIGDAHYRVLVPKGSYVGVQSHGASLSNLASLSQVAKPYPTQKQIIELLTRLANNMENKKVVSKILEEAGTIMLLTEEMIEGLVEASLSLPQVAQPVSQHTTSIILNKPYPTEEQIIELLTSLAKFKGDVIEVNRILEKAGSKMQLTEELITGLIDASEKL